MYDLVLRLLVAVLIMLPKLSAGYTVNSCWDSVFTRERCCKSPASGGDSSCWAGPFSFQTCCTGDPLCWSSSGEMSYERCCGGRGASECWNGLFTYGRCCSRDIVRFPDDCRSSPEAAEFISLASKYVLTNKTSPYLASAFKHISDHWPCEEAVILGLLYSVESNAQCGWDCAQVYFDVINRLMQKSRNPDVQVRKVVDMYINRVVARLNALSRLSRPNTLDIVLPHCGEDLSWLVGGLQWRQWYMESSLKEFVRVVLVNKCPLKPIAASVRTQLSDLRSLVKEYVDLEVYENIIGQECTGNLEYLVRQYGKFSDYALFVHPDMEEHIPNMEVFFDTIFFVTNGYFSDQTIFDNINFLPLSLNYLSPFWAGNYKHKHSFKRFHAELFSLSSPALAPDPSDSALYCCAQFLVRREAMEIRTKEFYAHALGLLNDPERLAGVFGFPGVGFTRYERKNKTQCEYMMLAWQLMFGEDLKIEKRENNPKLPLYFKTRNLQP